MKRIAMAAILGFALTALVSAEGGGPADDPIGAHFFPPDRVMTHSQEIGLEDTQRATVRAEILRAQPKFIDLQFDMKLESEKLMKLVEEKKVDEARVLAAVDRILTIEKEIKRTQMILLVRIKNTLTPGQQAKLEELARNGK